MSAKRHKGRSKQAPTPGRRPAVPAGIPLAWVFALPVVLISVAGFFPLVLDPVTDAPTLLAASAALLAAAWALGTGDGRAALRSGAGGRTVAAVGAVWVALVAAAVFAGRPGLSLLGYPNSAMGLAQLGAVTLVGMGAMWLAGDLRRALAYGAPAVVLIQAAVAVTQMGRVPDIRGTLSNSIYMSQVVLLCLPLVLGGEMLLGRKGAVPWWRVAVTAIGLATIAASGSRTSLVLAAVMVLALALWRKGPVGDARVRAGLGGALVLAAATALSAPKVRAALGLYLDFGTRRGYLHALRVAFASSPLVGHGPDSFFYESAASAAGAGQTALWLGGSAHDIFMDALVVGGVLLLAALLWLAVEVSLRWRERLKGGWSEVWLPLAAGLYVATAIIQPMPMQSLPLFALVLGASVGNDSGGGALPGPVGTPLRVFAVGIPAALALVCAAWAFTHVVVAEPGPATLQGARRVESAAALWRIEPYLYQTASLRYGSVGGSQASAEVMSADLAAIDRAADIAPDDPVIALERARAMAHYGLDPQGALAAFDSVVRRWRSWTEPRLDYARYLVALGREKDAASQLEPVVRADGAASLPADLRELAR